MDCSKSYGKVGIENICVYIFSHRVVLWGVVKYFALRAIHEILGKTPCYNFFLSLQLSLSSQ